MLKVNLSWSWILSSGFTLKYLKVSCIQPIIHFIPNPKPPLSVDSVMSGQSEASSAMVCVSGKSLYKILFRSFKKSIASILSFPPYSLGTHSPSFREKSRRMIEFTASTLKPSAWYLFNQKWALLNRNDRTSPLL